MKVCLDCLVFKAALRLYASRRASLEKSVLKFTHVTAQSNTKLIDAMLALDKGRKECVVKYATHMHTDHR